MRLRNKSRAYIAQGNREQGFTVLELMIATAIFGVILLVVAVGALRFSAAYYKGVTSSKTQAVARAIMGEVANAIQLSTAVTPISVPPSCSSSTCGVCIDNTLYSYRLGLQVTDAPPFSANQGYHGLVVSSPGTCDSSTTPSLPNPPLPTTSRELLGQHMRLGALDVTRTGSVYTIRVRVIYGDDDLLFPTVSAGTNWANEICKGDTGSQFCAVSDLSTTVEQRLL